jgi:carboxymethylenebutenolidase
MPEASRQQHNITGGYIHIVVSGGQQIPAYWSHPVSGGPFPGLVLLHDDWGLGPHMRTLAQRFAQVGYYVVIPDLFDGQRAGDQQTADVLEDQYKPAAGPKVEAALLALESHRKTNSKMAVIGWDLGAELATQSAMERSDIMATIAFYGDLEPFLSQLDRLRYPLFAIFAENDPITPRCAYQMVAEFAEMEDDRHKVIIYPETQHGFYNDTTPVYHEEAAERAWHDVLDFLYIHQGKPPVPEKAISRTFNHGRVY